MKNISSYLCALFLAGFFAAEAEALTYSDSPSWYTGLIGKSQNQILEPKPLGDISRLPKLAKVHFIVDSNDKLGFDNIEQSFDHDNINRCKALGFNKTGACGSNQRVSRYCPYDNSYYDQCCDMNFAYSKGECSYPNTISGNSCGGKFKCYCDRSLYPYTATSCPSPKIHNEDKCAEVTYSAGKAATNIYYSDCLCPSSWITCDSSIHQKGNGQKCEYNGVTTYASCSCEPGYSLLCEEFGPKSPMDYCFLKGTKYYKTCKTEKDVCDSLGYKYSKDSPCDADSVIASYCPRGSGNTYFSCKIDPDKYCKNRGFTTSACGEFQTVSSEKCNVPGFGVQGQYRKCSHTCKSRLAAAYPNYNFDGVRSSNGGTMVYTKNVVDNNLSASSNSYFKSAYSFRNNYSECANVGKPTVTVNTSGSTVTILSGINLSDVNVKLNLSNGSRYNVKLDRPTTFNNATVSTSQTAKMTVYKTTLYVEGGTNLTGINQLDVEGEQNDGTSANSYIYVRGAASLGNVYLFGRSRLYVSDTSGSSSARNVYIGWRYNNSNGNREDHGRALFELAANSKFKVTGTVEIETRWGDAPLSGSGGPALYMRDKSQLYADYIKSYNAEHFIGYYAIVCARNYWLQNKNDRGYTKIKFGRYAKLLTRDGSGYFRASSGATSGNCYASGCNNVQEIISKFKSSDVELSGAGHHDKWAMSVQWSRPDTTGAYNTYCGKWYY